MIAQPTDDLTDQLANQLTTPMPPAADEFWQVQSLSRGTAGIALLHIERARARAETWTSAHTWVKAATADSVIDSDEASLYLGAPAICAMLHAAADQIPAYAAALTKIFPTVIASAHRRVDAALTRINRREAATFDEYDLFRGLTGIGRLLLEQESGNDVLGRILDYLVRLTHPLHIDGTTLPGWWVSHDPDPKLPTPGGHANFGLAHGISGPLALLATTQRRGVTVPGQSEAIERICAYLDGWRHDSDSGSWWPQWITRAQLNAEALHQHGPPRPSWCYGTPGIGRTQQLAALALADTARQRMAEQTVAACLSDPAQLALISDAGLCHGWAGLYQTAWRTAHDALSPAISIQLTHLAHQLTQHIDISATGEDAGFLTGAAGLGLALHTARRNAAPLSGWDSWLLIS